MFSKRLALLTLLAPAFAGCRDTPAPTSLVPNEPLLASVGMPRFSDWSATGPDAFGTLAASFRMTGLGANASNLVTASADGSVVWACQTTSPGEFDVYPQPESRSGQVSNSSAAGGKSGSFSGTVFVGSPAATIQCLNPRKTLTPISASFANVRLSHPSAGVQPIAGTFAQTFFTITPESGLPTITDATLNSTTLVIDGPGQSGTVTMHNPGNTLPLAAVQLWIRQGSTYRAASGYQVVCTATRGELPSGDCTFDIGAEASNAAQTTGNGNLVAGAAILELQLWIGNSQRTVHIFTMPVTLQ